MTFPIVVVGAGQAASKAIETLRSQKCETPIILLGEEPLAPYQRPPLSKKFLTGEMTEEQLQLLSAQYFENSGIEFRPRSRAHKVDVDNHRLELEDGEQLQFGQLLFATGSHPRQLPLPGRALKGVHTLHKVADVRALQGTLSDATNDTVIIGGGYIGLEVAASLRGLGKSVTILEARERLLSRVVSPVVSDCFHDLHRDHGVVVELNAQVDEIAGTESVSSVVLSDGREIRADLVLIAVGGVANDVVAKVSGLPCQDGIVVNTSCRASDAIYAAGDCTRFPSGRYGRDVRLESVQNANDQGRAAAQAMLGSDVVYDPMPWFWSDQFKTKLQIAGLSQGHDNVTVDGDPSSGRFSVSYWRENELIAVDAINSPRAFMQARRDLEKASVRS